MTKNTAIETLYHNVHASTKERNDCFALELAEMRFFLSGYLCDVFLAEY